MSARKKEQRDMYGVGRHCLKRRKKERSQELAEHTHNKVEKHETLTQGA